MRNLLVIAGLSLVWCGLLISLGVFSGWIELTNAPQWLVDPWAFAYHHLRMSVVPFGALFVFYFLLISRMRSALSDPSTPLSRLAYLDRLLGVVIATFFGVGVIWTAVGMESALTRALDNPGGAASVAQAGAWGLLDKLVNGGLLLALSTTIFGGACGYGLKLLKIVLIGEDWDRFILDADTGPGGGGHA